jgi:hypothetical protein
LRKADNQCVGETQMSLVSYEEELSRMSRYAEPDSFNRQSTFLMESKEAGSCNDTYL